MEPDADLRLPRGIVIPARELAMEFSRGGGPGGQNVNKVNTRVTLRFDVAGSPSLPDDVRARLLEKLASKLTTEGVLVLHASEHREQAKNRAAAVGRLENLLREALHVPKARRKTKPTRGSVERRIGEAKRRSEVKRLRRKPGAEG